MASTLLRSFALFLAVVCTRAEGLHALYFVLLKSLICSLFLVHFASILCRLDTPNSPFTKGIEDLESLTSTEVLELLKQWKLHHAFGEVG